MCCNRLCDNFHQVWPLTTTYSCLNCRVFLCLYVMSRCDLDLWLVDLESSLYIKRDVVKVCTKFEQNRIEQSPAKFWHAFACNFTGWVTTDRAFSGVRRPNFTKHGQDIGRSSQHSLFSEFGYLAALSNAGGSKLSDILNDAKCRIFWPPVKIRGGLGEISLPIVEDLPTTEPPKYIWWSSTAEHGGLIKKVKESSWVKLKAFPTNVGRAA